MEKKCETCRFFNGTCAKYNVNVTKDCTACNDYAEGTQLTESVQRIQLND